MPRSTSPGVAVGNDRFQAVADLGALLVILNRQQQQKPFVLALFADAPLPVQAIGDVLDGLVFERIHQHDGDLHAGGLLEVGAVALQRLRAAGVQNVREIVDVAVRLELGGIEAPAPGSDRLAQAQPPAAPGSKET